MLKIKYSKDMAEFVGYGLAHLYNERARRNNAPFMSKQQFESLTSNIVTITQHGVFHIEKIEDKVTAIILDEGVIRSLVKRVLVLCNYKPHRLTVERLMRSSIMRYESSDKTWARYFVVDLKVDFAKAKSRVIEKF